MSAWLTNFPEADSTVSQLVKATTAVYSTIIAELLPTPAKSHYTFNLRDLSKVFQGMLMAPADRIRVSLHACILHCFIHVLYSMWSTYLYTILKCLSEKWFSFLKIPVA